MTKLYSFKSNGKEVFGHHIATNSQGLWVMEIKGTGEIFATSKDSVEEVIPYTVGVKFLPDTSKVYHYTSAEGKVSVGDLVLPKGGNTIAVVVEVNTKSSRATKELTGKKLLTESL